MVALKVPFVQRYIAQQVCSVLEDELKTKVRIERIDIGLPNRIIIDGLQIDDQHKKKMLDSKRLSAQIDILPLFEGEISISSIQVFGLVAYINKFNADTPLNCQFLIDAFKSKEPKKEKTPLNLHISSLVLRNSAISYDRFDQPYTPGVFNADHLSFTKVSGHIMMPLLTDEDLLLKVKKLSFRENACGFEVKNLHFDLAANPKNITIDDFNLKTTNSKVMLVAKASLKDKKLQSFTVSPFTADISTEDVALFVPRLKGVDKTLSITVSANGTEECLTLKKLNISSDDKSLALNMNAHIERSPSLHFKASDIDLHVSSSFADDVLAVIGNNDLKQTIDALKYVDYKGNISYAAMDMSAEGMLSTGVGDVKHSVSLHDNSLKADLQTPILHLGQLNIGDALGDVKGDIHLTADIPGGLKDIGNGIRNIQNATLKADIPLLTIKNYPWSNINIDATDRNNLLTAALDINDANIVSKANVKISNFSTLLNGGSTACGADGNIEVSRLNLDNLGIPTRWHQADFSLRSEFAIADIKNLLRNTDVTIDNFRMHTPQGITAFNNVTLRCENSPVAGSTAVLRSDFCDADISGNFDINTIAQSFTNILVAKLPTFPSLPKYKATDNNVSFDITVNDATALKNLLAVDLECDEPMTVKGFICDRTHEANVNLSAPAFSYNGKQYSGTSLALISDADSLSINANTGMVSDNGNVFLLKFTANARGNNLKSNIAFNNGGTRLLAGELNTNTRFDKDYLGNPIAFVEVLPSLIMTGDSVWNVRPSKISYSPKNLCIDNFKVEHNAQHVIINGKASTSIEDCIVADLHDVNVGYILDMVNFHSVDFDGLASGKAYVRSLFATPMANASIRVDNFLFSSGRMGTLYADAKWNNEEGQIDIDAYCKGNPYTGNDLTTTKINGFISPTQNSMSLNIKAIETPAEFMEGFCGSFMHDVEVTAHGDFWIGGSLKALDMTGDLRVNGSLGFQALGTTYHLRDTHVLFTPGTIAVSNDTIYDDHGNKGFVSGTLHHTRLGRWTYDLDVEARHLECFNFPTMKKGQTFGGYVVGSGKCKITGKPGDILFDVDASPEKGSYITYDVSSPDALQNQEFITWGTAKSDSLIAAEMIGDVTGDISNLNLSSEDVKLKSNVRMNLLVRCTPESSLRFLMDSKAGDNIELFGSGVIRANWHNKGGMQIFGNYMVDHGKYHMTMKQVIEKDFIFSSEGGLTFNGNPFESLLNLHAKYTINSVPLSDLNIGRSFSNNTTRVNCLMNISGTASSPKVDFALELPQASAEIQQMITSLINSEDEMNQQVVYLLAIGRFYNNTASQNATTSQTSLAMQSFISGTVSQKFNSAISGLIKNNNWNFGANVSPGDEGMNNAEYEGTISGRMLNNRLLIDGQFGYRDNQNATTSFIGDFDLRYLLVPSGDMSVHVYNQASDRYFTKNNLNTQGLGIILKHDFTRFSDLFFWRKKTTKK